MRLFHLARKPTAAIRIALIAALLGLGLNAYAHASHHHDGTVAAAALHAKACGYCSTFDALGDAPQTGNTTASISVLSFLATLIVAQQCVSRRSVTAQPRAPPRA
jgi:hypothetical protein